MEPFYIMVFAAGLVAANLVFQSLHTLIVPRPRLAFERRDGFLESEERLCLGTMEEAIGRDFRVFAGVAANRVLRGHPDLGRRTRSRADASLGGLAFDFLICSNADGHPLCGVLTAAETETRRRRRDCSQLESACTDAGLPLVRVQLADGYELSAIRRQLFDAIETAETRVRQDTPEPMAADEESLLAELAAAMQDPDAARGPDRISAKR